MTFTKSNLLSYEAEKDMSQCLKKNSYIATEKKQCSLGQQSKLFGNAFSVSSLKELPEPTFEFGDNYEGSKSSDYSKNDCFKQYSCKAFVNKKQLKQIQQELDSILGLNFSSRKPTFSCSDKTQPSTKQVDSALCLYESSHTYSDKLHIHESMYSFSDKLYLNYESRLAYFDKQRIYPSTQQLTIFYCVYVHHTHYLDRNVVVIQQGILECHSVSIYLPSGDVSTTKWLNFIPFNHTEYYILTSCHNVLLHATAMKFSLDGPINPSNKQALSLSVNQPVNYLSETPYGQLKQHFPSVKFVSIGTKPYASSGRKKNETKNKKQCSSGSCSSSKRTSKKCSLDSHRCLENGASGGGTGGGGDDEKRKEKSSLPADSRNFHELHQLWKKYLKLLLELQRYLDQFPQLAQVYASFSGIPNELKPRLRLYYSTLVPPRLKRKRHRTVHNWAAPDQPSSLSNSGFFLTSALPRHFHSDQQNAVSTRKHLLISMFTDSIIVPKKGHFIGRKFAIFLHSPANPKLRTKTDHKYGVLVSGIVLVQKIPRCQMVGFQLLLGLDQSSPIIGNGIVFQHVSCSTSTNIQHCTEAFSFSVECSMPERNDLLVINGNSFHFFIHPSIPFTEQKSNGDESNIIELPPDDLPNEPQLQQFDNNAGIVFVEGNTVSILLDGRFVKSFNTICGPLTLSDINHDHNSISQALILMPTEEEVPMDRQKLYVCFLRKNMPMFLEIPYSNERHTIAKRKTGLLCDHNFVHQTKQNVMSDLYTSDCNASRFGDVLSFNSLTEHPWEEDIIFLLPVQAVDDVHEHPPDEEIPAATFIGTFSPWLTHFTNVNRF